MKTFTNLSALFGSKSNNADSSNLTLGNQWINDGHRIILGYSPWWFMEKSSTLSTVASQQAYQLPNDFLQLVGLTVTIGNNQYTPKESPTIEHWNRLNMATNTTSNIPEYYFIFGNTLSFYPKPSSSTADAITYQYRKRIVDLSIADYTTGTITSLANAGTAIVGSGTTFTADMVGRWIKITQTTVAGGGDGQWYEIGTYTSATSIGLLKPYQGTTITGATAAYTIGQVPPYPETYHTLPVEYALWQYWEQKDNLNRALKAETNFKEGIRQMKKDVGGKTKSVVLDSGENYPVRNPNLYITL